MRGFNVGSIISLGDMELAIDYINNESEFEPELHIVAQERKDSNLVTEETSKVEKEPVRRVYREERVADEGVEDEDKDIEEEDEGIEDDIADEDEDIEDEDDYFSVTDDEDEDDSSEDDNYFSLLEKDEEEPAEEQVKPMPLLKEAVEHKKLAVKMLDDTEDDEEDEELEALRREMEEMERLEKEAEAKKVREQERKQAKELEKQRLREQLEEKKRKLSSMENRQPIKTESLYEEEAKPIKVDKSIENKEVGQKPRQSTEEDKVDKAVERASKVGVRVEPKKTKQELYNTMDINQLYSEVRKFLIEADIKTSALDRKVVDNKYGASAINKLIMKSYLISVGNNKITIGK